MVEILEGSAALKKRMPYGSLLKMAKVFNCSGRWISRVVGGDDNGDKKILECAVKIADASDDLNDEIDTILDEYKLD